MKFKFLAISGDDNKQFLYLGEWALETSNTPKPVTDDRIGLIMSYFLEPEPTKMSGGYERLNHNICRATEENELTMIEEIEVDFSDYSMVVVNRWMVQAIHGDKNKHYYLKVMKDHEILIEIGNK